MDWMLWGYDNLLTIILMIAGVVVVVIAQAMVSGSYNKYRKVRNQKGVTGFDVARQILDHNGLSDIHIVETNGTLTDHYDPRRNVIRLSREIFHGESIAALSVAAHEVGHAIQDKEGYLFMKIRSFLVPVVNLISYAGYFSIFIGIIFGMGAYLNIGIIILLASVLFQLVTLPVELNASKRARVQLEGLGLIDHYESGQVRKMLTAAAMTYVASLVSTVLNLLRLIILTRNDE